MSEKTEKTAGLAANAAPVADAPVPETMSALKRKREDARYNIEKKRADIADRTNKEDESEEAKKEPRLPKRKVAVCIGYCGTGYHGMQLNPPHKTIEGDIFQAFVKAGAISKDNSNDPKKSSLLRAARTDKGVHAAGNVISLKLIIEDPDIVKKINEHLPETVRVWGYIRTNKSFECRKMCNSRVYEYLIPSYSFLPPKPDSALSQKVAEAAKENPGVTEEDKEGEEFWKSVETELESQGISQNDIAQCRQIEQAEFDARAAGESEEEIKAKSKDKQDLIKRVKTIENKARRSYRISAERLDKVRKAFDVYTGVHNFHNYTLGKEAKDPSASRIMKSLKVSDPFDINGTEWLSIKIHGQSFMLHQIRKMVAMACLTVRTGCPISRISESFGPDKINIPKAPSLGLLLERPVYDGFNQRLNKLGHESLNFDKWEDQIQEFKNKYIYDKIYLEEKKENVFNGFFGFIDSYRGGPMLDYLTARGINAAKVSGKLEAIDDEDKEVANEENDG